MDISNYCLLKIHWYSIQNDAEGYRQTHYLISFSRVVHACMHAYS